MVVYEFSCRCEARYVGRTTQRLEDRIKQHVPTSIRKKTHTEREQPPRSCKTRKAQNKCDSAIGQHLLENPECAKIYNDDKFWIIGKPGRFSPGIFGTCLYKPRTQLCVDRKSPFSLLDSSSKTRMIASRLVIKSTNHTRHFPLTWLWIRVWLLRFC